MKAIILAAGKGSRLAELHLEHKSFAIINKEHLINFSLDLAITIPNITEVIIVVGYNAKVIIECLGSEYKRVPIKYVYQHELKGVAHAVKISKEILEDDFVMFLADEVYYNPRLVDMVSFFNNEHLNCVAGTIVDPKDFSGKPITYGIDDDMNILSVKEKPNYYINEYRGIGCCVFSKEALDILEDLLPNPIRGELEMGNWIEEIAKKLGKAKIFNFADAYVNVNYPKDVEIANQLLSE